MLRLEELTVEQKLGRVLCMRVMENADNLKFTLEMIRRQAVGCVQVTVNEKAPEVIARLRAEADYPLLIFNDMERGYAPSGLPLVPFVSLSACDSEEYTRAFAAAVAFYAKEAGFSGCWGPVLDILHRDAPCTVARCAGDTSDRVLHLTREINRVFASYGFLGTGKHFPGGQDMPMDTHMAEAVSSFSAEDLMNISLRPYIELMKEDLLPCIMTGHTVFPKIDPDYPASLSKKVISLFRRAGFDGLVFTDSLAMMGILQKYGEGNAMVLALEAGNDIILPNYRTPMRDAYTMMFEAYRNGQISNSRLDEAVRHVMEAEERAARPQANPYPVPENIREILSSVARDSVTALTEDGLSPALDPKKKLLFVVMTPADYKEGAINAEISESEWYSPDRVMRAIPEDFPNAEILTMPEFPTAGQNELILNAATRHNEVVFVTYCDTRAYLGTDGLTRRAESVIRAIAISGKLAAVVHFGNPLALKPLGTLPRRIFGYAAPDAQLHAIRVLAGKAAAKGTPPFTNLL